MRSNSVLFVSFLVCCISLFSGCAQTSNFLSKFKKKDAKAASTKPSKTRKKPRSKFDPKAQQQAYDRGLKLFSRENYQAAQKAWKQAVRMNPKSAVGKKSSQNLRKVEQILQSLREIEQQ